jgi:hypothetical protein
MDVCLCVVLCVGRGLGAGLIPRPKSPTKCLKGSISKKENPTPQKGITNDEEEEEEEEEEDSMKKLFERPFLLFSKTVLSHVTFCLIVKLV